MKSPFSRFLVRWGVSALGLWVASRIVDGILIDQKLKTILWVGLLIAIINAVLRPFIIILSLPALLFTLGIFMLVINGFMLFLVDKISSRLSVASFGAAILGGIIIAVVNFLVTSILEQGKEKEA